jgi:SDR family mycofactocin-dependent oxidoreductase
MGQLDGRVALVTGGGRGQGRAHALGLSAAGASVVVCDIAAQIDTAPYPLATIADLEQTVDLIRQGGGEARGEVVDVRDSRAVDELVDRIVDQFGQLDILVTNAGICGFAPVEKLTDQAWTDMIQTNLTGPFHCIRAVVPHMKGRHFGRIVTIASGAGRAGIPNVAHYCASKWGVIGLTKAVAAETARDGITVNAVCPTSVATPMIQNDATYSLFCPDIDGPTQDDARPRFESMNPMGRAWLEPEDITRAVLYLVTDPGCTTGAVLDVSLGASAARL